MKIDVDQDGTLVFRDVFNSVIFETLEGEQLIVCMRDGAFEIAVLDTSIKNPPNYPDAKHYQWYKASSNGIERNHLAAKIEVKNDTCN